jgi:hypothetical protein
MMPSMPFKEREDFNRIFKLDAEGKIPAVK